MADRLYNINIERAVLSSILFNPNFFDEIASKLNSDDFYLPFHRYLFEAMEELEKEDQPIDEDFLKKKLETKNRFNEDEMVEILMTTPLSNIFAYIDELKNYSIKRKLNRLSATINQVVAEEEDANEIIDRIQQDLYKITQDSIIKDFRDAKEISVTTLDLIKEMKKRENSGVVGVDTGYRELNELTAGFGKGDLIIVAARPAMGKTSFVLNIANHILEDNQGVAIFSLEMPAEQLILRIFSIITSIPLSRLKIGNLDNDEWKRLSDASSKIAEKKLFVDDDGVINIHQVRSKLRKLKSQHPDVSIAIIDYLQLMGGTANRDRHLEVSEISRGLKLLARELEMPILALSQLNRSLESRSDKRPMLSDLRESGSIEQDADMILFVYRDDVYRIREEREKEKKAREEGKEYISNFKEKTEEDVEIIIGKNRNGPIGIVNLIFQKQLTKFVDNKHRNHQEPPKIEIKREKYHKDSDLNMPNNFI